MISYIGMKTREVAIASKIEVSLAPDTEVLDEVLVVGYGTTKVYAEYGDQKVECIVRCIW